MKPALIAAKKFLGLKLQKAFPNPDAEIQKDPDR